MPRTIRMPDSMFFKLLFRSRNYTKDQITKQEKAAAIGIVAWSDPCGT